MRCSHCFDWESLTSLVQNLPRSIHLSSFTRLPACSQQANCLSCGSVTMPAWKLRQHGKRSLRPWRTWFGKPRTESFFPLTFLGTHTALLAVGRQVQAVAHRGFGFSSRSGGRHSLYSFMCHLGLAWSSRCASQAWPRPAFLFRNWA